MMLGRNWEFMVRSFVFLFLFFPLEPHHEIPTYSTYYPKQSRKENRKKDR